MIIFKNNTVTTENTEIDTLDGVYNALIVSSQQQNELYYICHVYVPEVFGEFDKFCSVSYPTVTIPYKQDNDDEGHVPEIGELVRVSFDEGNSNSGRFLYYVPLNSEQVKIINKSYIEDGILPSDIIPDITDPNILNKIKELLPYAYYVTCGTYEPVASSFKFRDLISNAGFDNYFIEPLTMPVASYSYNFESLVPIFSTNIYVLLDVVKNIYNTNTDKTLSRIFEVPPTIENKGKLYYPEDYDWSEDTKAMFVAALTSGLYPDCFNIMFPNVDIDDFSDMNNNYYVDFKYWWYTYQDGKNIDLLGSLMYNNKTLYENEWASSIASWQTGLNSRTNNNKLMKVILLCLTICPWIVSTLIRYTTDELSLMEAVRNSEELGDDEVYDLIYGVSGVATRDYSTLFKDDSTFLSVGKELDNAIKTDDPLTFAKIFKEQVYSLFNDKQLVDKWEGQMGKISWDTCNMENKFNRLFEVVNKIINE